MLQANTNTEPEIWCTVTECYDLVQDVQNTNRTTFGIPDSNCDLFWSVCVCFTVPASTCPHRGGEEDSGSVCLQSATGDGSVSVLLLLRAHCTLVGMNAQSCLCHKQLLIASNLSKKIKQVINSIDKEQGCVYTEIKPFDFPKGLLRAAML